MIRIPVPGEIRKYETKLVGPLTGRQTVCLLIGAGLSGGLMFVLKYFLQMEVRIEFFFPIIIVCMAFTTKPYGLKFEDYVLNYIIDNFISPPKRKYETENYYQKICKPYVEIIYDKKGKPISPSTKSKGKDKKRVSKYKYVM